MVLEDVNEYENTVEGKRVTKWSNFCQTAITSL
ncbi:hypothetical protein B4U79_13187 [Dinothrombium tinctorium]|uniref:Uncharacterized protein n=1 Tax=Dinothrombium tinctorium TaxID=1965070 RepID=A0A3S3P4S0_9ACAR|nr:hypothetical protein B4U79_10864 [Dinothrombium tinctorium]RWS15854.1 hypothetical protein B4U79_10071 [Dinothrombium tinctorium]RWS15861.1 hypothetical protein B4U79_13187 [Dinothrombium tinctorium]